MNKVIKTAQMTIYLVNDKISCARCAKTGRFVKLAIANIELKSIKAKKLDKQYNIANSSVILALIMFFVFFFFAFLFKSHGFATFELLGIFSISLAAILAVIAIVIHVYSTIEETILTKRYKWSM